MYKFEDHSVKRWVLLNDGGENVILRPDLGTDGEDIWCVFTRELASELAKRLQFFAEHGRLPNEAPTSKWLKRAVELEGDADIHAGPKVGVFSSPPPDSLLEEVLKYDNDFMSRIAEDCDINPAVSCSCEYGTRGCVVRHYASEKELEEVSEEELDFYEEDKHEDIEEPLCRKWAVEQKLYIVHGSSTTMCSMGFAQDFIVGIFDDRDVAECEQDNYLYDLEQAGHDTKLFAFWIKEEALNKVTAEIPKK